MSAVHGSFTWYELMTTDVGAARRYYSDVVGWGVQDVSRPEMAYFMFTAGEAPICGLMKGPPGVPPGFVGYVAADDVDGTTDRARGLGATVHVPPTDIPSVGRFSMIADPQGAAIGLFQWQDPASIPSPNPTGAGHVGWHELMTSDWQAALGFYGELFGWRKADAMDMGPMGTYQLFSGPGGGDAIGGMFNMPPEAPHPFWLYYVTVPAIDPAIETLTAGGERVINGPMEVPGGAWIVQGIDPQGAIFALVGKRG